MASVVVDVCLVSGSMNLRADTGFLAASGDRWEGILNSHFRDTILLELHTPLSNWLAFLFGSNAEL